MSYCVCLSLALLVFASFTPLAAQVPVAWAVNVDESNAINCAATFVEQRADRGSPPRHCRKSVDMKHQSGSRAESVPSCQYTLRRNAVHASPGGLNNEYATVKLEITQKNCPHDEVDPGASLRVDLDVGGEVGVPSPCTWKRTAGSDFVFTCSLGISPPDTRTSTSTDGGRPVRMGCNTLCNITVAATLDYEHYAAYHSVHYGMGREVLRRTLDTVRLITPETNNVKIATTRRPLCCAVGLHDTGSLSSSSATGSTAVQGGKDAEQGKDRVTRNKHSTGQTSPVRTLNSSDKADVRRRFREYAGVYFIGPSHMRYLWDMIAVRYLGAAGELQEHPQHHSDLPAGNTWFVSVHFAMELPGVVGEICAPGSMYAPANDSHGETTEAKLKPVAFVFQVGSWDLDYYPVGAFLSHRNSTMAVVDLVRRLSSPGSTCLGHPTRVLWLTDMPIPDCPHSSVRKGGQSSGSGGGGDGEPAVSSAGPPVTVSDRGGAVYAERTSCFNKGYRNNYAIAAANQYFLDTLTAKSSSSYESHGLKHDSGLLYWLWGAAGGRNSRLVGRGGSAQVSRTSAGAGVGEEAQQLVVVDAFSMVYPHRQHHICGLHYLCCKRASPGRGRQQQGKDGVHLLVTPGGGRLLDAVLAALLR